jgi:hypothetical protein
VLHHDDQVVQDLNHYKIVSVHVNDFLISALFDGEFLISIPEMMGLVKILVVYLFHDVI